MTSNDGIYKPSEKFRKTARINSIEEYKRMYDESIKNPERFWLEMAQDYYWKEKPSEIGVLRYNFDTKRGAISINAFKEGVTNICYNTLDRHIENDLGDKIAFYWEGNDSMDFNKYSYQYIFNEVCKFGNVLRSRNVVKGDRVAIYMPMIIELVIAVLGCARIGAVHSVIFGGYSADSVADRIIDGNCKILITSDGSWRGHRLIELKTVADKAMSICNEKGVTVEHCIVAKHVTNCAVGRTNEAVGCRPARKLLVNMTNPRDQWWHEVMSHSDMFKPCPIEWMESEDPLFILYTSGSTGKPKGVLHSTGGYMVYTGVTYKYVFDHKDDDVYWCTADIGWITGHSYTIYGPMSQGVTSVIFEGIPSYPDAGRFWQIIDKYLVSKFYTAPTAIRTLMKSGDSYVKQYSRASLKLLGTVGEPINPRAWEWYYEVVGDSRCPIVDTYWQTETGGHVITPLPGATTLIPGLATLPFFGIEPALMDELGNEVNGPGEGYLVFKKPWPGMLRTVFGNHELFEKTYFKRFPGYYTTGDGAKRTADGYYCITGRIDDMLNVSGHLISTAQVESALVSHQYIVEAAVVGAPHDIKGECIYCFVTVSDCGQFNDELKRQLIALVRNKIGAFATPDVIQEATALPKTRSGKIMRRVLRKIASNETDFGDLTTLADPNVVDCLVKSINDANDDEECILKTSPNVNGNVYHLSNCGIFLLCSSECYIVAWKWCDIINSASKRLPETNFCFKEGLPQNSDYFGYLQILSMFVDESEMIIYAGASDGVIHSWQISNDNVLRYLTSSKIANTTALSLTNQKGFSLVAGCCDGTVRLWDNRLRPECMRLSTSESEVARAKIGTCVNVVTSDVNSSDWLLCGGEPQLGLWNIRAGKVGVVFDTTAVTFDALLHDQVVLAGGTSNTVCVWDMSGQLNSEIALNSISTVHGLLHRDNVTDKTRFNEFFVCGWGAAVDLYSNVGYRKRSFDF